jgi:hypothetical protein
MLFFVAAQARPCCCRAGPRHGHLQKIMYVHVPSAWISMIAFFVVFVASMLFLVKRDEARHAGGGGGRGRRHPHRPDARARLHLGRPTWGIWWTWDPRLTTTAILFLIYAATWRCAHSRRTRTSAPAGALPSASSGS